MFILYLPPPVSICCIGFQCSTVLSEHFFLFCFSFLCSLLSGSYCVGVDFTNLPVCAVTMLTGYVFFSLLLLNTLIVSIRICDVLLYSG